MTKIDKNLNVYQSGCIKENKKYMDQKFRHACLIQSEGQKREPGNEVAVLHGSVLLLIMNFVITLSKYICIYIYIYYIAKIISDIAPTKLYKNKIIKF